MIKSEENKAFLDSLGITTRNKILDNIAQHYRITRGEALSEVLDKEAESLLDYVTGDTRQATSIFFNKWKETKHKFYITETEKVTIMQANVYEVEAHTKEEALHLYTNHLAGTLESVNDYESGDEVETVTVSNTL